MGLLYLEFVPDNACSKFICAACSADVASSASLIWEGYMAAQQPAYLFRSTFNVEPFSQQREELLSTGTYTLVDVQCRSCCTPLGWKYIKANRSEQKYKEGSTLLKQELLTRVNTSTKIGQPVSIVRTVSHDTEAREIYSR